MNFESRIDLSELHQAVTDIRQQIGNIIVGQAHTIDLLLTALLADGHILLEGVPGVAKTLIAKLLSRTISVDFSRIQFTPDMMPSDVLGTAVFNPKISDFEFRKGPIFSNIILIDEINRSPAKTQSALFEVMEERQITNAGSTYPMAFPFLVIATQNPIEQEGTYRLPEAQLDRFMFKILVGYPNLNEEIEILKGHHHRAKTELSKLEDNIKAVLNSEQLANLRAKVKQVLVDENILEYIAKLIHETRRSKFLYLGASPRASVALLQASKAFAAIRGRDFVTPEDIQELLPTVLRHRVALTPEKEMEGASIEDVLKGIVQKVEVPR
ncbi:MAG: AAA family ATPase [Flectobacillus sp.]|uniref:AAA family ATPase n=1 Tax=Flectobacillus sp. TaxID=50419 RepID=UPI003B9B29A0